MYTPKGVTMFLRDMHIMKSFALKAERGILMFSAPIKHVQLKSMEELKKFSMECWKEKATPMAFCVNNGQIAYADEAGVVSVTPYRPEIWDILRKNGYREASFFVPFSNREERPDRYKWLVRIANEECWATTFEQAFAVSVRKGVLPFLNDDLKGITFKRIRDVTTTIFDDKENHHWFEGMVMEHLGNQTDDNIGTYIVVDSHNVMVCDEYGRTFILTVKGVVNDFVNCLIAHGYTRTVHPEYYIHEYSGDGEEESAFE